MHRTPTPERKIRYAIQSLLATHRFFGVLALQMPTRPGKVKTISGDGTYLTYSPEWVADASHDEIKGSIAHLVYACALKHHLRRGARDAKRWKKASRIATKMFLQDEQLWSPKEVEAKDLPIERIYEQMRDEEDSNQQSLSLEMQAKESGEGQQDGKGKQDENSEDGEPVPGEIEDAPEDKAQESDQRWDKAASQAAAIRKAAGQKPGQAEAIFSDQHVHLRNWRQILEQFMREMDPSDYSWSKPNRRFIDDGLYLPSLHGEGMGPIVVAIDTSGSVNDERVNRVCSEMFAIIRDVKPSRVHVIQCDYNVKDAQEFEADCPPSEIKIKGRGGTRFQPVFDHVREHGIQPDALVYLTDLEGRAPSDPGYPVIWAVENEDQAKKTPFGTSIVIED